MAISFFKSILQKFTGRPVDWDELEEALIRADLGVPMTARILRELQGREETSKLTAETVVKVAREEILKVLPRDTLMLRPLPSKPKVILVVGVNGTGKTTSTAKLAQFLQQKGHSILLAAADTFRAAAIEQLQIWGTRIGAGVIAGKEGGDAAGIVFDGVRQATAQGIDVLIVDTAGRLQNKTHLMDELTKIRRVLGRLNPEAPHDVLLVLDATTGQNALAQVEVFRESAGVTGLIMTKLDGTARGGILVAAAEKFGLPIHAIGVGEQAGDLRPFDARAVARAIAGLPPE